VFIICNCFITISFAQLNWPGFRGLSGGVVEDKVLPVIWSSSEQVVWKVDIPGRGWSSPVVWGDKIFLTSVVSEKEIEEAKKGLYFGGNRDKVSGGIHYWKVFCLDWKSGKILWQKQVHEGLPTEPIHIKNTYASETPVTDGEHVYFYFGNLGIFCFDLNGHEIWQKKIDPVKMRYDWGTSSSPVLHDDVLYIVNDNDEKSYLLGLNKNTGETILHIDRNEESNWVTSFIWENELRMELVTCGTNKIRSYDFAGDLLWELSGMSVIAIPTPVAHKGLLYLSSGYVGDEDNRPVYAVRSGASGDITPAEGQTSSKFIAWYKKFAGPYNPSPIVYGDYFYVLYDGGKMSCFNAKSGEEVYIKQKIAKGANAFTASPWANDGKIFCLSEHGDAYIIKAGPEFELLGQNALEEMSMATPATLRGSIILRTIKSLYRIE
jgi:outer membrane protein assembly factor BamB